MCLNKYWEAKEFLIFHLAWRFFFFFSFFRFYFIFKTTQQFEIPLMSVLSRSPHATFVKAFQSFEAVKLSTMMPFNSTLKSRQFQSSSAPFQLFNNDKKNKLEQLLNKVRERSGKKQKAWTAHCLNMSEQIFPHS